MADFDYLDQFDMLEDMKSGVTAKGEVPSAAMVANARSLSKLASGISMNDGKWMNKSTWEAFHSNTKTMEETFALNMITSYT